MIKLKIILIVLASLVCGSSHKSDTQNSEINILFIGNSLTYTNNLPELVKHEAKKKGVIITSKMIAFPNYALVDHWDDGKIQNEIINNQYDYVIAQQGPSSQPFGRKLLLESGKDLSKLCNVKDTKLCYFMVWPSLTYYHTFDGVIKNYTDAAASNNDILLPVGKAWKNHFDSTNNFEYYGPDGFHPSLKGSQKAAEIIVEQLFTEVKN